MQDATPRPGGHAPVPRLIALDWGTTSLRAYLMADARTVLDERAAPKGVMQLGGAGIAIADACDAAFEDVCGAWLDAWPALPVVAAGMVGSTQGWREAPYVDVPIDATRLGASLQTVRARRSVTVHIVPGLIQRGELANVMRGEETQIVGALQAGGATHRATNGTAPVRWIGLPGTHSKWVAVRGSRIERFRTFMTGELYALLCTHSLLGRTMQPSAGFVRDAFERGVRAAQAGHATGLLATIFGSRARLLAGDLAPAEQADYLSGVLIGHELAGLAAEHCGPGGAARDDALRPMLIGDAALCERYKHAASLFGWPPVDTIDGAAAAGLWVLAERAGLLPAAGEEGAPVRVDEPAAGMSGRHEDRPAVDSMPDHECPISGD
ncbi:MAG: putative 2-dehydro-3-deoxygalactonokinase DgoK1 [Burkholderia lata]|uniref:Putative 2-dehydro-3-deoxygalactonokinase DgoK1 n=1 Tax=Burkholderia lata (strain ATCC 17760 / DSM 23089 / LMG 22485 / NCIMB 9086 / R18194 / 383) TaxID=482957 RepID=A0A833UL39_BURL3|nr:2-dehydro-3-deoxygalactonokinase [Burkholderia lata]KAF1036607.1 MAG: putative 2-dehydro-3-deoxygalactonokinase DgoK1 [Burkholderia lata]